MSGEVKEKIVEFKGYQIDMEVNVHGMLILNVTPPGSNDDCTSLEFVISDRGNLVTFHKLDINGGV